MGIFDEMPRGQLSTFILSCLSDKDKYGYEIIDEVLKKTNGKISIKQPSLYSSLKRMEEQSLISSYWRDSDIGGKRHYYHLTDLGKKHLEKWQENLPVFNQTSPLQNEDTHFLQQENLFDLSKRSITEIKEQPILQDKKDDSFMQYDLFSNQSITKPKEEQNSTNSDKVNVATNSDETYKFEYIKKGNKSFSDNIKAVNVVEEKKFITNLNNLTETASSSIQEYSPNINKIINLDKTEELTSVCSEENNILNDNEVYAGKTSQGIDISELCDYVSNNTLQGNIVKNEQNEEIIINDNFQNYTKENSGGVFITERLDPKDIPKQPRFEPRRFEMYISDDSITPSIKEGTTQYEDRIKQLYEKCKENGENQELEVIDSKIKFSSYADLQEFYNNQGIKFMPYQKKLYKSNNDFDMIKISKMNLLTSLFMFSSYLILSIVLFVASISLKGSYLNSPILYASLPAIMFCWTSINFIVYKKSPEKRIAFNINKFKFNSGLAFLGLLIAPLVLAINLFFGFNFINFKLYAITILYPCLLIFAYPIYYFIQKRLSKLKSLY